MNARLLLLTFSIVSFIGVYAQTPGIPYQAVILNNNASGAELPGMDDSPSHLLSNTLVSLRFSIHNVSGKEYEEIQRSVMVDQYGMINVVVGKGTSTLNYFDAIDWNGEEKWLDVDIDFDNGSNYENLDYLPLYRLPAPEQTISLSGDSIILSGGGSISLAQLLANAGTDDQQLSLVGTVLYLQDGGSVDLTQLASDTNFTNNLIGNASFVTNLSKDSLFIENLIGGTYFIQTLTTDSMFIDGLVNDSTFQQIVSNNRQEVIILAGNGQSQFATPEAIDSLDKIDVYRNGIKVGFTAVNTNTIELESSAVCFQNDEIRIVQYY